MQVLLPENQLLVCAHFGEARSFIEHFHMAKKIAGHLEYWQGEQGPLLIVCHEGPFAAGDMLGQFLSVVLSDKSNSKTIRQILNLGVAGLLDFKHELGKCFAIRTCYLAAPTGMHFHSYTCNLELPFAALDCVTSFKRARTDSDRNMLAPFASLVDREVHALARVAQQFGLPFGAIKVCSDRVGDGETDCQTISENALKWSQILLDAYLLTTPSMQTLKAYEFASKIISSPFDYKLTHAQTHKAQQLFKALDISAWPASMPKDDWKHLRPKDQVRMGLLWLEEEAFPWRRKLREHLQQATVCLKEDGVVMSIDPELEHAGLNIQAHLSKKEDVEKLNEALNKVDWHRLRDLFDGNFHV